MHSEMPNSLTSIFIDDIKYAYVLPDIRYLSTLQKSWSTTKYIPVACGTLTLINLKKNFFGYIVSFSAYRL